jgi:uncharacterized protein (TIGR00251 family)
MILSVRVIPKSSRILVKEEQGCFKVYLTKPASDGLANQQLIEVLAKHLKIKKYQIEITKGQKSRDKLINISNG